MQTDTMKSDSGDKAGRGGKERHPSFRQSDLDLPFDVAVMEELRRLRRGLLRDMVMQVRANCVALKQAISTADGHQVDSLAHKIKGVVGQIGALRAHSLAAELEQRGRMGQLEGAEPLWVGLAEQISRVAAYVETLEGEGGMHGQMLEAAVAVLARHASAGAVCGDE